MKTTSGISSVAAIILLSTTAVNAGDPEGGKGTIYEPVTEEVYNGGRGILTTTGPTGLFINPTSGTLDQGGTTLQYCFFLPAGNTFDPSGHGLIGSYGITDALEVGFISLYIDGPDEFSIGPQARYRFFKDEGAMPEVSLVGYSRFGDATVWGLGPAAFKRFRIGSGDGVLRSVGIHGGVRYENNDDTASKNLWNGYGGIEFELPMDFYLVGEVSTKESGRGETKVPYALGVQWRQGLINISAAGIQRGDLEGLGGGGLKFFFGVGLGFQF